MNSTVRNFSWLAPVASIMSLIVFGLAFVLCLSPINRAQAKTITFLGKTLDQTNYSSTGVNFGTAGYWFPQFNAASPVTGQPTDDNHRIALPSWAMMDFTTDASNTTTRTFSQDAGGVRSEGGKSAWNTFTLPNGEVGLSGSVVDPNTKNNSNNTVNRINLGGAVPQSFLLRIVVDNTNGEHDPKSRIEARAETPAIDNRITPMAGDFNGLADVYTFQYDGWVAGDFIKIRFNSGDVTKAAGFAGLMFDVVPEPASAVLILLGAAGLGCSLFRERRV